MGYNFLPVAGDVDLVQLHFRQVLHPGQQPSSRGACQLTANLRTDLESGQPIHPGQLSLAPQSHPRTLHAAAQLWEPLSDRCGKIAFAIWAAVAPQDYTTPAQGWLLEAGSSSTVPGAILPALPLVSARSSLIFLWIQAV